MANSVSKLQMSGISKQFPGVKALDDVSFKANSGEVIGLVGVNGAGKSTLMNVLGGIFGPDEGTISIDGEEVILHNAKDAEKHGIAFIHQELLNFESQTVAENIFISHLFRNKFIPFFVSKKTANIETKKYLKMLGSDLSPTTKIEDISVGERQVVEIARALALGSEIVIFDEPTSSLSLKEKENLFKVINRLKNEGKAIIYITHFLDEVMEICDRYVVLRNGQVHGNGSIEDITRSDIVRMIIGKELRYDEKKERSIADKPVLKVEELRSGNLLKDISFHVNEGEILGIWGLMGSGRTEIVRAILGLDPIDHGRIFVSDNDRLRKISPKQSLQYCGYVTESRHSDGLFLSESLWKNTTVTSLKDYSRTIFGFLDTKKEVKTAKEYIDLLNIATPDQETRVKSLSGGNQQKVVFSKWLNKKPKILILDEPTRGVDVGAKLEINNFVRQSAEEGTSTLLITSEVEEMVGLSDRVIVLRNGEIIANVTGPDINNATLMEMSLGEIHSNA